MEYSSYQQDIFKWVQNPQMKNAVVEAIAGSGKSFTIKEICNIIPSDKSVVCVAFNVSIAQELQNKINKPNVWCKTSHALGLMMLNQQAKYDDTFKVKKLNINEYKYKQLFQNNWDNIVTQFSLTFEKKTDRDTFKKNVIELLNFCQLYLCRNVRDVHQVAEKYGYTLEGGEADVILWLIDKGLDKIKSVGEISYVDMITAPPVWNISPSSCRFDWVLVDEAQDLSVAQQQLVQLCKKKKGTRYVFVGDKSQCIMAFVASDPDSFDKLKSLPDTISLPLSINYRCPEIIGDIARRYVPQFETRPDAPKGVIEKDVLVKNIHPEGMVVCRNTAPLIKLYMDLLQNNRKCYIKGIDISATILSVVDSSDQLYISSALEKDGLLPELYRKLLSERQKLIRRSGISVEDATSERTIVNQYEMINTIKILSEGIDSKYELVERVKKIFGKTEQKGICLITNHKVKGLEADYVYHLCPSLTPSKLAQKEWEKQAETNLEYVLYTRSKKYFGVISEEDFPPPHDNVGTEDIVQELAYVDAMLNAGYSEQVETPKKCKIIQAPAKKDKVVKKPSARKEPDKKEKLIQKYWKLIGNKTLADAYEVFNDTGIGHSIWKHTENGNVCSVPPGKKFRKGDVMVEVSEGTIVSVLEII